jgi:aminoglycoside phosphotransferase (APT) family kinase protein
VRHGYTNATERRADVIYKRFVGPDSEARSAAELRALTALHGRVPVPEVISSEPGVVATAFVSGAHGQDLIADGRAHDVLRGCGAVLRSLHALDPSILEAPAPDTGVIRHGDFGPNNVLFDTATMAVTAVVDWEFSGVGKAVEDIAWCEWIVRMHHPDAVGAMPAFFEAYGWTPPWQERKSAMLARCQWLEAFCTRWDPHGAGTKQWQLRGAITASWKS